MYDLFLLCLVDHKKGNSANRSIFFKGFIFGFSIDTLKKGSSLK